MVLNGMGPRGFRGAGGGSWPLMPTPPSFRGTAVQVCGMWPFSGGSSRPAIGVPIGPDIETGATVCCDGFSWFHAGLASSPSMSVFGLQGLGKSSFAARQIIGLADQGVRAVIPGDLKGEYTNITHALGGDVQRYGRGESMNALDQSAMMDAARRVTGERRTMLLELAQDRAATMVAALVQIVRRSPLEDWEYSLLVAALKVLYAKHDPADGHAPTLPELTRLTYNPTQELMDSMLVDDLSEYRAMTRRFNMSLNSLMGGQLGKIFAGRTTRRVRTDAPAVSIDISPLRQQGESVMAAVMLATWSEAFASIEAANELADAGVEKQQRFLVVMDEMWRPMRIEGAGLVDKMDALTRLNRSEGVGNLFVTHSPKDMRSMSSAADNMKARGFAERSSIIVTAGLAKEDLRELSEIRRMSEVEINTVASWSTPDGWKQRMTHDSQTGESRPQPPPGAGKVLIKLGERAGIQTQVKLTPTELRLHDTNQRWVKQAVSPVASVA